MNEIKYLVGQGDVSNHVFEPYDDLAIDFLAELSTALKSDKRSSDHPDVLTFAFWCRKANIRKLKTEFGAKEKRLGWGKIFHITPSNVPITFAYSFAFGLLAGNANIVRLPSKRFYQVDIVCDAMNEVFKNKAYKEIRKMTSFVAYERSDEITARFSGACNGRVIWGGDDTVLNIRKLPMDVRSVEIGFSDRYSICVISAEAISRLDEKELTQLSERFYADTYLMDQNACSSPYLMIWLGEENEEAREKFWKAVYEVAVKKYDMELISTIDKYTRFCEDAATLDGVQSVKRMGNLLYRVEMSELPKDMSNYKEACGFFYEYKTKNIADIAHIVSNKYQTVTYFGVDKDALLDFVVTNRLPGIDRIVPIGQALDIGVIWDGYDVIRKLSRIVDVK